MKVVVASDSYKGCLSAKEVAGALASALRSLHPGWTVVECPLADGGEGTVETILTAVGGTLCETVVSDPLERPVFANYGLKDDTAFIEVAEACGLKHLSPDELDPLHATSYGVGELLLAARAKGARHFVVGLGGTATCDGGAGMISVDGLREAMKGCTVELLCDVVNPFVGKYGAARVFAPQKGASAADVEVLEKRMEAQAFGIFAETGVDVRNMAGAGAAGGLGGAMMAYFNASGVSGIERILDLVGFESIIDGADLIVTGEGKSDLQTLGGKVAHGVLRHSKGIPVALVSGCIEDIKALREAGFSKFIQATPEDMPLSEALKNDTALRNLVAAATSIA
ncbi:MAG: glycerate kinase [Bacteroidales bacterium]|nr:glycerate kinase [Bacteroidales bacterium]